MKNEHRLNVFIPDEIYNKINSMDGTLKSNVCTIFAHHFEQGLHNNQYIEHLNAEIMYLRELHRATMDRALMLPSATSGTDDLNAIDVKNFDSKPSTPKNKDSQRTGLKSASTLKRNNTNKKNQRKTKKLGFWSRFGF